MNESNPSVLLRCSLPDLDSPVEGVRRSLEPSPPAATTGQRLAAGRDHGPPGVTRPESCKTLALPSAPQIGRHALGNALNPVSVIL